MPMGAHQTGFAASLMRDDLMCNPLIIITGILISSRGTIPSKCYDSVIIVHTLRPWDVFDQLSEVANTMTSTKLNAV